jgi:hypothetical protein
MGVRAGAWFLVAGLHVLAACRLDAPLGNPPADARVDGTGPRASFVVSAGGPGADVARAIALDREGNIVIAGSFQGTARFGGHELRATHAHESFVAKLDPDGRFLWAVSLGGTAKAKPQALALDRDGSPHVIAAFTGTVTLGSAELVATGSADLVIAKLDASGRFQWAIPAPRGSWNVSEERGLGIAVDVAGRVTITGGFRDTATFGATVLTSAGADDVFVARLAPDGRFLWAVPAGGDDVDQGNAVAVDASGRCHVAGFFTEVASFGATTLDAGLPDLIELPPPASRTWSCFVAELDGGGNFLRTRTVASPASSCNGIALGPAAAFVTGAAGGSPLVARLDADGTVPWVVLKEFPVAGSPRRGNGIAVQGGAVVMTGELPPYNSNVADLLVGRLDSGGKNLETTSHGGTGEDRGFAVALDAAGNALVAGAFSGSARLGEHERRSAGGTDAFVWKVAP